VVDTLGTVTETTMDFGGRAIESAKDFLGLYPIDNGNDLGDQAIAGIDSDILQTQELDGDIDTALMETETTLISGDSDVVVGTTEDSIVIKQPLLDSENTEIALGDEPLEGNDTLQDPLLQDPLLTDPLLAEETTVASIDNGLATPDPMAIDPLANPDPLAPATPVPAYKNNPQSVATSDLIHEVKPSENLWDIAKATTGDANNWHVLADINNLAPNASVFPGQELTIPADMIKPGFLKEPAADTTTAAIAAPAAEAKQVVRLAIPEGDAQDDLAAPKTATVDIAANAERFKVGPGETLWNFAKRTTGDATNWKAIAAQNNFSEKQAVQVYPGQSIYVPSGMVKQVEAGETLAQAPKAKAAEATETAVAKVSDTDSDALEAAAKVLASSESILGGGDAVVNEDQPIKIVEAKFQAEDATKVEPVGATELAKEATQQLEQNAEQQIMVSGTYYPKAIYLEADFSSSLLMRVSPGTQLSVTSAAGPWYQVMTEKGIGYVHTRDIR